MKKQRNTLKIQNYNNEEETNMTETEILKKYGNLKMTFCNMDRHRAKYKSLTGNVICSFIVEYRDYIQCEMLLKDIITYGYESLTINADNNNC